MADFVGAIDQGTTSSRFMVFDSGGAVRAAAQIPHDQVLPRPGWVEHDPVQILDRTRAAIGAALGQIGSRPADLAAIGIANQRETTVVWNRRTGLPYANAIVWQDTRTHALAAALEREGGALIRERTGLPPSTYFSGPKLAWLLGNVEGLRADAERGDALFGTIDSWLIWNLTGGPDGGAHVTDVTNASRTMLMDLRTRQWDDELLALCDVPRAMLPAIRPSNARDGYGILRDPAVRGARLAAVLGDQHAATVGQACLARGEAKNTYGTGSFLMLNTGEQVVTSDRGLISTLAYQWDGAEPVYALEGSVAVTGAAVQWLRDQLGLIQEAAQIEALAARVPDAAGAYFVPAFSGLFAPHWRPDARGAIVGLSRFHSAAHLARATLEAICYQTREVIDAMRLDLAAAGLAPAAASRGGDGPLKVDGGVSGNDLCMQLQADILGVPVARPQTIETTAWGAASAAGLAVGVWPDEAALRAIWRASRIWEPRWDEQRREDGYRGWAKAVSRTLDWVDPGGPDPGGPDPGGPDPAGPDPAGPDPDGPGSGARQEDRSR